MISNLSIGHYGRFGNQLFQIAAVIGISRESNQEYKFLPWLNADHKERFGSDEDVECSKYFEHPLPFFHQDEYEYFRSHCMEVPFQWGYSEWRPFSGYDNCNLSGHFQSEKYFNHCIDEVRHYMKMKGEQPDYFKEYVAIHVRRGDYDNNYHTILQDDYYEAAIMKFSAKSKFLVFSDDPQQAGEMFTRISNRSAVPLVIQIRGGFTYLEDFRDMKCCGGFITANSSYSLMAAILSEAEDKKIVCPKDWFGPAWPPGSMPTDDLYPAGSIVI